MSVSNIIFEHVHDDYYFAQYFEFTIVINNSNGYFNATKFCRDNGKRFSDWYSLFGTKSLLHAMKVELKNNVLLTVNYKEPYYNLLTGSYIHLQLFTALASWLSPQFYSRIAKLTQHFAFRLAKATIGPQMCLEKQRLYSLVSDIMEQLQEKQDVVRRCKQDLKHLAFELVDMGREQSDDFATQQALRQEIAENESVIQQLRGKVDDLHAQNTELLKRAKEKLLELNEIKFLKAKLELELAGCLQEQQQQQQLVPCNAVVDYKYKLLRKNTEVAAIGGYQYTSICVQAAHLPKAMTKVKRKYPFCNVVYEADTNNGNLHNIVKTEIGNKCKHYKTKYNDIGIPDNEDENLLIFNIDCIYKGTI